jgi:WD40 repeat protein
LATCPAFHVAAVGSPPPKTDVYGDPLPEGALARFGTVRFRHGDYVRSVGFSNDGKMVISVDQRGRAWFWDTETGRPIRQIRHGWFEGLMYDPGDGFVIGWTSNEFKAIDVDTGKERPLVNSKESIAAHAIGRGKTIITANWVFKPKKDSQHEFPFSAFDRAPTIGIDVCHWDTQTGKKKLATRIAGEYSAMAIGTAQDSDKATLYAVDDNVIKSWATNTGKKGIEFRGHSKSIARIIVAPNGKILASLGYDTLRLWDTTTGKVLHSITYEPLIERLVFSPNGDTIAARVRDGDIHLWNVKSGKPLRTLKVRSGWGMAFSPDGKTLAVTEGTRIALWDLATGRERLDWPGHRGGVTSVAFSNDGQSLATGGADGAVYLWQNLDPSKPRLLADDLEYVHNVVYAPGRPFLVGSGWAGVRLWDDKGARLIRKHYEEGRAGRAQFFPDGKTLLVAGDWQLAWLWSIDSGKVRRYNNGPVLLSGGSLTVFAKAALSPDGKTLVETTGIVRDPLTGTARFRLAYGERGFNDSSARFAPDSKTLIFADSRRASKIVFLEVANSRVVRSSPQLEDYATGTFAFSPDGRVLAVGGYDGSVRFLEYATAGVRLKFDAHAGRIRELAFSPDGRQFASASEDGAVLLWDVDALPGVKASNDPISEKLLGALWSDLGAADAAIAYRAMARLAREPKKITAFLLQQLRKTLTHDPKQLRLLIADLDSGDYVTREKSMAELSRLADIAGPAMLESAKQKPSVEVARRLDILRRRLNDDIPTRQQLQILRAMEVLERDPTPEVRAWLAERSQSVAESWITREAIATLDRLEKNAKGKASKGR